MWPLLRLSHFYKIVPTPNLYIRAMLKRFKSFYLFIQLNISVGYLDGATDYKLPTFQMEAPCYLSDYLRRHPCLWRQPSRTNVTALQFEQDGDVVTADSDGFITVYSVDSDGAYFVRMEFEVGGKPFLFFDIRELTSLQRNRYRKLFVKEVKEIHDVHCYPIDIRNTRYIYVWYEKRI